MTSEKLMQIYELLYSRYGRQFWWPGDGALEIIIGAILTQNTNWSNVEKAITNLKAADCLDAEKLYQLDIGHLAQLIRPAGYYNIKARRVKNLIEWLFENYSGKLELLDNVDTSALRQQLLSIKGVGQETADSILLYALGRNVFVVDAYTFRIATRHRLIDNQADYLQLQRLFEDNLDCDAELFNEFHALLVKVGKEHCRPKARCAGCPLQILPYELEEYF